MLDFLTAYRFGARFRKFKNAFQISSSEANCSKYKLQK